MQDQQISLSLSLINAVLQYLGSRPYGEVFQLVQELQKQAIPQVKQEEQPESAGLSE
jgi:hypothetical protein